ncbi:DUF6884 domain-containing protein [Streptomyces sp. TLI_171]|uniref:DUF6884 domain-containing protein n=1 Tax=Streptomyces sp. TLI_171 TaxID=1938859 RepID=UPI000C366C80|nr:DUF6884 domain-containing protein [Streptomyces sp. TLI_171]RKE02981.1 hypothetical protein BX266_7585 [Streptomyces sp. TLI_171]
MTTHLGREATAEPRPAAPAPPRLTAAQHRAVLGGAKDPLGLLPKSVNLRTTVSLAALGYVGLDQSEPFLRGQLATKDKLDVWGGVLTEEGWARARAEGAGAFRIVVVGCGKTKQPRRVSAGALYTGSFHGACRATGVELLHGGGRMYILSAAHGLLDLDTEIDPYDLTVGDPGSVDADIVRRQVLARGLERAEVTVLAGRPYVDLARAAWPNLDAPLSGARGIGEMRQRLAHIRIDIHGRRLAGEA